jgi:NADPH:quinone reductase-like Zn-dependent oxidoreductase
MASSSDVETMLPKSHRAILLRSNKDPYDMSVVEKPTPQPGPGSAIIQVLAASVLTYGGEVYSGRRPYPQPRDFVPGLSAIGRIAAVGEDSTTLTPGQLIYFDCYIHGRDDPSALILHGLFSGVNPQSNKLFEQTWRDSTYAEYAKVPLENCFPLDEARLTGISSNGGFEYTAEDLLYLGTVSVGLGGLRDVGVMAGEKVIIAPAAGAFGSATVVAAVAMGARVVAIGRNLETLQHVKNLRGSEGQIEIIQMTGDVDADIEALTQDGPADVFFDISPAEAANSTHYEACIRALRRGGRMSYMGAAQQLTLPAALMMRSDMCFKGKWMYTKDDIRVMIKLAETGFMKLGISAGITTVGAFPLEQFGKAFEVAANMKGPYLQTAIVP